MYNRNLSILRPQVPYGQAQPKENAAPKKQAGNSLVILIPSMQINL
jgi:hypothetical protein